jgi:hypothetical protein
MEMRAPGIEPAITCFWSRQIENWAKKRKLFSLLSGSAVMATDLLL